MSLTQVHSYQTTPCFSLIKEAQMGWASVTESYDPLSSDNILCNPKTPHYNTNKKKLKKGLEECLVLALMKSIIGSGHSYQLFLSNNIFFFFFCADIMLFCALTLNEILARVQ